MTDLSLNEVEATAKRAARGAGLSWGMAEEAGKAVRWLSAQGLPGCAALADLLDAPGNAPTSLDLLSSSGPLCPLAAGVALSDMAGRLGAGDTVLSDVAQPLLLLPFLQAAARQTGRALRVGIDGTMVGLDGAQVTCSDPADLDMPHARRIVIAPGAVPAPPLPQHTRAEVTADTLERLNRYAHRTYAPATEASRLLGAGAGLSDND
ncbi:DUF3726 domain-containing protein [Marimonas lutisalis]|uniref:DUF3726 domain-containing protein n=1 Tax=Marimonas lutisalis TaxID=2545756 RepID=UPI0010F958F7|nr:DUF3726 domain-containing protein [Marimonas lutisalis]